MMVGKVPEELQEIWSTLAQCICNYRGKGESLAEVVIIIFASLGCLHYQQIVRFEAVDHVVCVTDGDVHNEFG